MTIRAVVFDIGGILETIPTGGDPTTRFPDMITGWEWRLNMEPGALKAQITALNERLERMGKSSDLGTCSETEWFEAMRLMTGWDEPTMDDFVREFWDIYCGNPNPELAAYLGHLRPRYQTALLSNSFDGARREEEARFHFSEIADLLIYSHEEGVAKPDQRIYAIACERLGAQPEEMVFLDDTEGHVAAAAAYGIHAVHFRDNAQAIADIQACLDAHTV
ncbi:MAG TPA: HAD-IA family hydrolase [Ktedonobacterales bacterium]|nr:HAD-IA family hydrolase [Ktedonobacterales bacterium]